MSLGPLGRVRHLHFVGVGGVGMCGLAEVLLAQGITVSGCDLVDSDRTRRLVRLGASVTLGHDPDHIDGVDAVVVSSAIDLTDLELVSARKQGVPVIRRAEMLAELMRSRLGVAVAGTHGKTTTSSLVAHLLTHAGLDPTVVVGGLQRETDSHARFGLGQLLVCEADEYDRSFLELNPVWAVITNSEEEHLDCYRNTDELEEAFVSFANRVPFYGAVVACADDPGVRRLIPRMSGRVVAYGTSTDAWLRAENIAPDDSGTHVHVVAGDTAVGDLYVPLPGRHNVLNSLAAVAVGLELDIPAAELLRLAGTFPGVARRFEVRGERAGITVVDDYAHHPTEVGATIAAARQAFPGRRLVAVFQPHLYSRTRDFADAFGEQLAAAEVAVVLPVYAAREAPLPGVDSSLVVIATRRHGNCHVTTAVTVDETPALLDTLLCPGDVVLTMGAGDVFRVADAWLGGAR